jgi:hypothetical protein
MFLHLPRDGIEEGVEAVGRVNAARLREGNLLDDLGTGFPFPNNLKLLAECVILD